MNVIQRYLFRRLLGSFALAFPAMTLVIWISQALRELSLITERGQNLGVFFEAVILFLPGLIVIIGPVALLISVMSTVNGLNSDSELVSIAASGRSQRVMLRPVLALAVPVLLVSAACSIYFSPAAARGGNALLDQVNADVIGSLIRPGQFRSLGDDVILEVGNIRPDGTLEEIFVFDEREGDETFAYLAGAGATYQNEDGHFLLMQDGVIQRRQGKSDITVIRFESYAFDLSALAAQTEDGNVPPSQREIGYLINPDPNDPVFQNNPFSLTAEFHSRLTVPLYAPLLALLPLAMLGQVHSARQRRGLRTTITALLGVVLIGTGLTLGQALPSAPFLLPVLWGVPIAGILLSLFTILTGRRLLSFGIGRRLRTMRARARRRAEAAI